MTFYGHTAGGQNHRWSSGITYINTQQDKLIFAIVLDFYSLRIIGWSMDRWISRHLAIGDLNMALGSPIPEEKMIYHSDLG